MHQAPCRRFTYVDSLNLCNNPKRSICVVVVSYEEFTLRGSFTCFKSHSQVSDSQESKQV